MSAQDLVLAPHAATFMSACSFCGKSQAEVHLVIGPCVAICEECIETAAYASEKLAGRPLALVTDAVEEALRLRNAREITFHLVDMATVAGQFDRDAGFWENKRDGQSVRDAVGEVADNPDVRELAFRFRREALAARQQVNDCARWLESCREKTS